MKYRIAIVYEGDEEECLFNIALECGGVNEKFDLTPINAHGAGNIPSLFQDCYSNPSFDCTIAVYDVDGKAQDKCSIFNNVRNQLSLILGSEKCAQAVSFCTNPNILQILLMGCGPIEEVSLLSTSKQTNSVVVSKYWKAISTEKTKDGIIIKKGYEAYRWQLEIIKNSYIYEQNESYSYSKLLDNSLLLNRNYLNTLPASNVQDLLNALKNGDIQFFEKINMEIK